jgi:hypothetical protein
MSSTPSNLKYWVLWLLLTLALGGYLGFSIIDLSAGGTENTEIFLPGETTHGHHNIEMACTECHTDAFGGKKALQKACMNCHAEELELADDSHPKSKFTDPRNASTLEKIDARYCVSCHVEHNPDVTQAMGVTLPNDYCFYCHAEVAEDLPDHEGLAFDSCASAGCHNYHDNTALYEDFLIKHLHEPEMKENAQLQPSDIALIPEYTPSYPKEQYPVRPLRGKDHDGPGDTTGDDVIIDHWAASDHARSGVNCTACHMQEPAEGNEAAWVDNPGTRSCQQCHTEQADGFKRGKHGMRPAAGLGLQSPAQARILMHVDSHDKSLTCTTCHSAHSSDIQQAAVEACLGCHEDRHSLNYKQSPHYKLLLAEQQSTVRPGSGVSCATCHLPRTTIELIDGNVMLISDHNQNANLRPNEKMVRSVCLQCHGLGFVLDSLADQKLIETNFNGRPAVHIESLEMAERKLADHKQKNPSHDEP